MIRNNKQLANTFSTILIVFMSVIFLFPFAFMIITALKSSAESSQLKFSLPESYHFENFYNVIRANDYQILKAFKNSLIITFFSVLVVVIVCSLSSFVLQRRKGKVTKFVSGLFMLGLMIPAAIIPTIVLLRKLYMYKTMFSMVLIEVSLQIPFATMLYKSFFNSVPREIEEAAVIDGCNSLKLFYNVIFPLLKPITASIVILNSISTFNDFTNPLYFLPGADNVTVQLTLYNYIGRFASSYNLLFADALLVTLPMVFVFIIFNKYIISGIAAGSIKA